MDACGAFTSAMGLSDMVCFAYIDDLTDEHLMMRPHTGCNHLNWQIGHLVASENNLVNELAPGKMPALPAGFVERYAKETSGSDNPSDFDTKDELVRLAKEQRAGTIAILGSLTAEDLDQPAPERLRAYAPTVGAVFALVATHWMMHCGQWVVVRRQLGKPALF